jgi:tetratricopeptide (TPR) repeat protein
MRVKPAVLVLAGMMLLATATACASVSGASTAAQEDFAAANHKYEEGKFAEALPLYLEVGRRVSDWKVLYDIGNCYYKTGNYLSAKVYYLKARKLQPLEASITRNIAMTNRHFRDVVARPEPDFVTRTVQLLESKLSLDALSVVLLLAILLLNLFLFLLLTRGRSRKLLYGLAFSLLLAAVVGAYHLSRTAALAHSDVAVVWEEGSQLRSGPGEDNTELFRVNPGLEVRIIDRFRDWVQVTASEQIAGWIEKKRLVLI